jgi:hypothetical protein
MLTATEAELKIAWDDCVKRRGREEAQAILRVMARVDNVADVPEAKRFLTTAALERRHLRSPADNFSGTRRRIQFLVRSVQEVMTA